MPSFRRLLAPALLLVLASTASAQKAVLLPLPAGTGAARVVTAPRTLAGAAREAETAAANFLRSASGSDAGLTQSAARSEAFFNSIFASVNDANKADAAARRKAASAAAPRKTLQEGPSPFSDEEIIAKARSLAQQYKGSPWSYTEYNSVLYPTMDNLRQQGVPERQIELFKNTCEQYPGRPFNPWSGD